MTKAEATDKIIKLRNLAGAAGTIQEGATAASIAEQLRQRHAIDEDEIRDRIAFLDAIYSTVADVDRYEYEDPTYAPRRRPSAAAAAAHRRFPSRVHMAIDNMLAVCGVGPTFVWTFTRSIAINSGMPCPYCLSEGVIDARRPSLRLAAGRPMPARARDERGRFV